MQRVLFILGIALILLAVFWPWIRHLPLGRLPGDIVIQREGFTFFFPLTTMILISALLTLILTIWRR